MKALPYNSRIKKAGTAELRFRSVSLFGGSVTPRHPWGELPAGIGYRDFVFSVFRQGGAQPLENLRDHVGGFRAHGVGLFVMILPFVVHGFFQIGSFFV